MSPKLAKMIVKTTASILFSVAIGITYKTGKKVEARIDEHYATPQSDDKAN